MLFQFSFQVTLNIIEYVYVKYLDYYIMKLSYVAAAAAAAAKTGEANGNFFGGEKI